MAKSKRKKSWLTTEQRREILAVTLLALALFLFLALAPIHLLGARAETMFPSGNAMGMVGATLRALLAAGVGGASLLVPVLVLLGALRTGDWLSREWTLRLALLSAGLLLLLPVGFHVVGLGTVAAGAWGAAVGERLVTAVGWLGALLLCLVLLVALSVLTLGWNPLRTLGRGMVRAGGTVGRGARKAGSALSTGIVTGFELGRSGGPGREAAMEEAAHPPDPVDDSPVPEPAGATEAQAPEPGRRSTPAVAASPADLPDPAAGRGLERLGRPPLALLTEPRNRDRKGMERELTRLGQVLVEKLRTFNVESELGGRTTGPVVTQFEVIPAPGVKVNRIANLEADLALAMKAQSIRIVAPIPGKGAVGVEIPNPSPQVVYLREILEAPAYGRSRANLPLALGRDLRGDPYVADLARMPHALVAGATGAGKSVCLNTIITSLVYRHTPETLRLLMIDPKMVELAAYADLPHLRHPVVTDPKEAAGVLKWAVMEMERRYALLSANGVRSIAEFNRRVEKGTTLRRVEAEGPEGDPDRWVYTDGVLPYVVVVVDELADLMMTVQGEVEKPLTLLAQKARAIGIHLIVATQRPSVNVITGLIKANFPCRIAFRVASKTDSRTILDQNGADALLGNGDMLFLPPGQSEPVRIQGAFIPTEDTDRLTAWFREQAEEKGVETAVGAVSDEDDILDMVREHEMQEATDAALVEGPEDWDELFRAAAEVCIQHEQGSTSLLQRKLRIGYGRAARIVDQLHEAGILGPPDGSKPRDVLVGMDAIDLIIAGSGQD